MSCRVNLQALPSGVFEEVFTPENVRGRTPMNSLTPLSFPKSRSALWDGSPAGEKVRLQLCSHRKPRLVLLEKALRLAQRHVRHSNKPCLHCFFLGSMSVDSDEEGVTLTLDRFDPGRDQAGSSGRVPSAALPGDVLVPCLFSTQTEVTSDAVVQPEAELHHCFRVLQQFVSSRQTLDLSQLLKVRGHVVCSQQSDAAAFSLSWSAVCPAIIVDVQPVRAVPIIPTALLRNLTSISRLPLQHAANRQRGFLTMEQTRKLLLLLESDPKASSLPLVGLWLSGVTHIYNPQVWAWCLRFLFSSALRDRVLSESRCFLLVLFGSTHRTPQFFKCRAPGPGPQLDYQLLTAFQSVTLYQVAPVDGQTLQCELSSEDHSLQMEVFREAQNSFKRAPPPAAGLSVSDQDSGVEDEDLSPRPSPSPHAPVQQTRRVQPSVPELSLLIDSSFSSNQNTQQDPGSRHRLPPPPAADRTSAPPTGNTSSSVSRPALPQLHSTPNCNVQQPYPLSSPWLPRPSCVNQCCGQVGAVVSSDTYQLLLHQDRQLRLLQAQVQMLLEAQGNLQPSSRQVDTQSPKSTASVAVETGASLFWGDPVQDVQAPPSSSPTPPPPLSSPRSPSPSSHDLSVMRPVGGAVDSDVTGQVARCSPLGQHSVSGVQSPAPGESVSMCRPVDDQQSFYHNLMTQLTSRLQESDSTQEVEEQQSGRRNMSVVSDHSQSCQSPQLSSSFRAKQQNPVGDLVANATLQQLRVNVGEADLTELDRSGGKTVEIVSTLASINPAAIVSKLSVSDPTVSSLFPGGSVDLSLEANAIALRYLSDSQLSRLSLGGHAPQVGPTSSPDSLLSPSNMSLATRKYMRRYGLIKEEDGEDEEEQEEVRVQEALSRQPLADALNVKFLPQSQLIRDLRPKMQLFTGDAKSNATNKENCLSRRPSLVRASSRQTEGSVGNILDLSRLRQLPKLF